MKLEKSYFIYKQIEWAEKNPRNFEMGTKVFSSTFSLTTRERRRRNICLFQKDWLLAKEIS